MGNAFSTVIVKPAVRAGGVLSDGTCTMHHVENGGCFKDFGTALRLCNPEYVKKPPVDVDDVEACVNATAALRRCFAGNPQWFKHKYLRRMDEGLDEDLKPSPEQIKEEERESFRWWTGMRRS